VSLGRVLHQISVPRLRIAKLLLEDAKRMFNAGADARLQAFNLIEYCVQTIAQVRLSTPAWSSKLAFS
jgi:hypothetical protein